MNHPLDKAGAALLLGMMCNTVEGETTQRERAE
jgi:hypothetical protein